MDLLCDLFLAIEAPLLEMGGKNCKTLNCNTILQLMEK